MGVLVNLAIGSLILVIAAAIGFTLFKAIRASFDKKEG